MMELLLIFLRDYRTCSSDNTEFENILYEMDKCGYFTAMGLFDVNISAISGVLSTVVTYLIALLQMPG